MEITFLGTGTSQGVPVIACDCDVCRSADPKDQRLRSSVLVGASGIVIAIDAGPDFRQQMLREKVSRLDAILITHEHKDHIGGLDDVRAYNFIRKKAMDIYARRSIHPVVLREFDYAFSEVKYPGVPQINLHEIDDQPFEIKGVRIVPIAVQHGGLPVFGYRIGDFTYLTDISSISPEEISKLYGSKIIVLAALRKKAHHSHMNLDQAIELLEKIKPGNAFITHISHYMGLHEEVNKDLPENIRLAYDGLSIQI